MLIGLMVVRNEEWVLGLSLRAALLAVDEMIVLDHASTDRTPEILAQVSGENPGRLQVLREEDEVWREASIRQRLLQAARLRGATHVYAIDADEVLTGNLLPRIRGLLEPLAAGEALRLPWLALWRGLDRYRDDDSPVARFRMILGYRDSPALRHVSWESDYDLHTRVPEGIVEREPPIAGRAAGGVLHLAAADWRRLRAKTAWYKMTEVLRFPWRRSARDLNEWYGSDVDESGLRTAPVEPSWWAPYAHWLHHVDLDAVSWHEEECDRLWMTHGASRFTGLELWREMGGPAVERDGAEAVPGAL